MTAEDLEQRRLDEHEAAMQQLRFTLWQQEQAEKERRVIADAWAVAKKRDMSPLVKPLEAPAAAAADEDLMGVQPVDDEEPPPAEPDPDAAMRPELSQIQDDLVVDGVLQPEGDGHVPAGAFAVGATGLFKVPQRVMAWWEYGKKLKRGFHAATVMKDDGYNAVYESWSSSTWTKGRRIT